MRSLLLRAGQSLALLFASSLSLAQSTGSPASPAAQTQAVLAAFQHGPYRNAARGRIMRPTLVSGIFALVDPTGVYAPIFVDQANTLYKPYVKQNWIEIASGNTVSDAREREIRATLVKHLDLTQAIPIRYGSGTGQAIVLSAYDCPVCRSVEQALAKQQPNLTVYIFPGTLVRNDSRRLEVLHAIWCSANPSLTWEATMLRGTLPAANANVQGCERDAHDVDILDALFDDPTLPARLNPDGTLVEGAQVVQF